MEPMEKNSIKGYGDTYLYSKYPLYSKKLTDAIMQDPVIDKKSGPFQDVIYEVKRARVSDALPKILVSDNVVLLDCDDPLPRAFKVFAAKDFRGDRKVKIFIDCTKVITKDKSSQDLIVDESKLLSYLINAGFTMIYHKAHDHILRSDSLVMEATTCFSKCFTYIVDYLLKISIQETSKVKVLYLSAMYFLLNIVRIDPSRASMIARRTADITEREATMLNVLMDKAARVKGVPEKDTDPYGDIKQFIRCMTEVMKFNKKMITEDIVVERWMTMFGPSTVLGLEYFPAFSAMMTDAYVGGHINQQKTIENVCKVNMINYTKNVLSMINNLVGR